MKSTSHCYYLVEGECEKHLISELKIKPELLIPGKVEVFNVLTRKVSTSKLMNYISGSIVVFVFDTDIEVDTSVLEYNINLFKKFGFKIVFMMQVRNLEDELVRSTDISKIEELTSSQSTKDFKRDFLKCSNLRSILEKHQFSIKNMWCTPTNSLFAKYKSNVEMVLSDHKKN